MDFFEFFEIEFVSTIIIVDTRVVLHIEKIFTLTPVKYRDYFSDIFVILRILNSKP